jgi:cellulose synthase/poly-beta-1,6-N-acetylglucosamine synthase-like glycosyltransferase
MRELQRLPRNAERIAETQFLSVREAFGRWPEGAPEVSILLVARNEADWIVPCLASLAAFADPRALTLESVANASLGGKPNAEAFMEEDLEIHSMSMLGLLGFGSNPKGSWAVPPAPPCAELIVVDNGSTDGTAELAERCGATVLHEHRVGIDFARQRALEAARGRFILSVDADTLYPPGWGHAMVRILREQPEQACLYGNHRFIPDRNHSALSLALYRWFAEPVQSFRSVRHEFVNALGCNMAFRRLDALRVGGWMPSPKMRGSRRSELDHQASPDGRLALRLSVFGRMAHLDGPRNTVWTSPRGLDTDGGMLPAIRKRLFREVRRSIPRKRTIVID